MDQMDTLRNFKWLVLAAACLVCGFQCDGRYPTTNLTIVHGTVTGKCSHAQPPDIIRMHQWQYGAFRQVDSTWVGADGRFRLAYSSRKAVFVELRGEDLCGSSWLAPEFGKEQSHEFVLEQVKPMLLLAWEEGPPAGDSLRIRITRLIRTEDGIYEIPVDRHNFNTGWITPVLHVLPAVALVPFCDYRIKADIRRRGAPPVYIEKEVSLKRKPVLVTLP